MCSIAARMNILQIVSAARTGGVERHVVLLSDLLRQRGHQVTTICPHGDWLPEQLRAVEVPVIEVELKGLRSMRLYSELPRLINDRKIDLIHSHLTRATYFALLTEQITRRPVVSSVHVLTHDFVYRRLFSRRANRIITVAECLREALIGQGIPSERVRTIHNGTDFFLKDGDKSKDALPEPVHVSTPEMPVAAHELAGSGRRSMLRERAQIRRVDDAPIIAGRLAQQSVRVELNLPPDAQLIGLFARMEEFKGPRLLAEAAGRIVAAYPRAHFLFVGPIDPLVQHDLITIAGKNCPADHLHFTGGRDDVQRLMSAVDMVTLPSRYEACSMAIIESMAMGKPVIATHIGGNPELIVQGETGLLIERSADALAEAVMRLLSDTAARERMGNAARNRAISRFSASVMVNQVEALYAEIAGDSRR